MLSGMLWKYNFIMKTLRATKLSRCHRLFLLVGGHAPTSEASPEAKASFWGTVAEISSGWEHVIYGFDANSRAHLIRGDTHPEVASNGVKESANIFGRFVRDNRLLAPALVSPTPPQSTWTSNAGDWKRH